MLLTWMWLPVLGLLDGQGEAQSCRPDLIGVATNVARGRPAFQSSTFPSQLNSVASKAMDGNCSRHWIGQNTCTHTKRERGPWWYVDLGSWYAISSVVMKNSADCCGERLRGAEIRVAGCMPNCGLSKLLMMLLTWMWLPVLGLLAGQGEAQSCRPDLIGVATNVARGRPAFQSSTFPSQFNSVASKAVDGNCSGRWIGQNTCTHTKRERGPWWYVDLGSQYVISSVVVKNREDCCGERLRGAEIRVGNFMNKHGKNNPLCGRITNTRVGSISTISCKGRVGRYVTVTVPGRTESLALCEVEIYGTRVTCEPGQGQG